MHPDWQMASTTLKNNGILRPCSFWPDRNYVTELLRPWKLVTFGAGMLWLFHGALNYGIADWDIGISVIMGGLTYLCAPWSVSIILIAIRYRPAGWPWRMVAAFVMALLVVDWVYWVYHTIMGNEMYRLENFVASSALYFLAGTVWLYRGSLQELLRNVRSLMSR